MIWKLLRFLNPFSVGICFADDDGGGDGGDGDGGDSGSGDGQGKSNSQDTGTFTIPDEFKEKGWAKKVKSPNDVFNQLNTMEELIGKKSVPFDFENATENEIKEHLSKTRPENTDAYKWGEEGDISDEDKKFFGEMLLDSGIPPFVGNKLIEKFLGKQKEIKSSMFSKDGFTKELQQSFGSGEEFKKVAGDTANIIKTNLNEKDKELLEHVPNNILGLIYRLTNNVTKDYKANDGGDRGQSGTHGGQNVEELRTQIRKDMQELAKRPHSAEEKKALQQRYDETYKRDPRLQK